MNDHPRLMKGCFFLHGHATTTDLFGVNQQTYQWPLGVAYIPTFDEKPSHQPDAFEETSFQIETGLFGAL